MTGSAIRLRTVPPRPVGKLAAVDPTTDRPLLQSLPDVSDDHEDDGRRRRGLRNRQAVVEATLSLLEDGDPNPSASDIAERAGVSLRSVFRHFDDLDALFLAGIQRQAQRTAHLYAPPARGGKPADRVQALVRQRRRLHEAVAPVRRGWVLRYRNHPTMVPVMAEVRAELRRQIVDLFAGDLVGLSAAARRDVIDAIDVATSFSAWDHLRFDQGLPPVRAAAVLRRTVSALLESAGVELR